MSNIRYADIYTSLLRYISETAKTLTLAHGIEITPYNFDTVGDTSRLPAGNLFGISDWSLENIDSVYGMEIPLFIGFAVLSDMNLDLLENKLLNDLVSHIAKAYSESTISIYKANQLTEEILGVMTFGKTFKVMPARHDSARTFKMVQATLLCPKNIGY